MIKRVEAQRRRVLLDGVRVLLLAEELVALGLERRGRLGVDERAVGRLLVLANDVAAVAQQLQPKSERRVAGLEL